MTQPTGAPPIDEVGLLALHVRVSATELAMGTLAIAMRGVSHKLGIGDEWTNAVRQALGTPVLIETDADALTEHIRKAALLLLETGRPTLAGLPTQQ
jgi:hypothetical protein